MNFFSSKLNLLKNLRSFENAHLISRFLFYVLILCLPLNLGYHFFNSEAFLQGLLVDYLIPTIYVQDILVSAILVFWLFEKLFFVSKEKTLSVLNLKLIKIYRFLIIFFLFSVFLSTLISPFPVASTSAYLRLLGYFMLLFYISEAFGQKPETFENVWRCLSLATIGVSILGILQYLNQGAVFNNYLFFGEQPYNFSTPNIVRESFFGFTRVPSYGLFRHPNVFGAFLSISLGLIYIANQRESLSEDKKKVKIDFWLSMVLCVAALFFTFSFFSWLNTVMLIIGLSTYKSRKVSGLVLILGLFLLLCTLLSPIVKDNSLIKKSASIERRVLFLESAYQTLEYKWPFGTGYNSSIPYTRLNSTSGEDQKFMQPVHNMFVLIFLESGIFSVIGFLGLLVFLGSLAWYRESRLIVPLIMLVYLGFFDHYFFTQHQTLLLMTIVIGSTALYLFKHSKIKHS